MKLTCQCISGDKIIMSSCSGDRKQNCTISGTPRKAIPVLCETSVCYYCSALIHWCLYSFIRTPSGAVAGSILQKFWPAERILNTWILFHALPMSMENPDFSLKDLLPEPCIFNAVITSVPCPDFFSKNLWLQCAHFTPAYSILYPLHCFRIHF